MLSDLRVVNLTSGIAGAYCAKLLADAGAQIITLESDSGDPLAQEGSGALFEFLNTSQTRARASARDVLALCASADIVLDDSHPTTLDIESLTNKNPKIVFASITPFGLTGPWSDFAANEFTLQAWCGSTGSRGVPDRPPVAAGGRIGEWVAGSYCAVAVMAAWMRSARTGQGEIIDLAIFDAMALTMNTYTSVFAEFMDWPKLRRPTRTVEIPAAEPSSDGFAAFTTNSAQQFSDFLIFIERPDLIDDTELSNAMGRFKRRDEVVEMIQSFTKQYTTAELLERAELLRIPSGPVGNGSTVTSFDHFQEVGTFVDNPGGRFVQPRVPYKISEMDARLFTKPVMIPDGQEIPDWLERQVEHQPVGSGELPLSGVRILDCTAWWAGPAATHMLACLGADVIKIESVTRPDSMRYTSTKPPSTDQWWEWGPLFHGVNNTKRGITVDLTNPEGREIFLNLVETADVVLENFSPRVMEQFDLDYEALAKRNPKVIMVRLPAYGLSGPWRNRTGFAQTMESIIGMAWVTGWPDGPPLLPRGACDPFAAMHAVFATMIALVDRADTGRGHLIETTLIETALNAAAEQIVEYEASGILPVRRGNASLTAVPQSIYPAEGYEEWLAISIDTDSQWTALVEALGRPAWATDLALKTSDGRRKHHSLIDDELTKWCSLRNAYETACLLSSLGIPAAEVIDARDVSKNPQLLARNFLETETHSITGSHPLPMIPFRFASQGSKPWMRSPSPVLGEHNQEVLGGELGMSEQVLERLKSEKIIGERPVGA